MTESLTSKFDLGLADAWALAEVLRHKVPCATDCEYCEGAGVGYILAAKVQKAIQNLKRGYANPESILSPATKAARVEIRITEREAWMIYRYLPRTAYDGAEALLLRVFEIITTKDAPTELPPWATDLGLEM